MSKLNASDIQGFALRGYNMPFGRYAFLEFNAPESARALLLELLPSVTTGQLWDTKPQSTLNIALTHNGLVALELPLATLVSFPVEFQLGMRARAEILGDTGANAPEHWDSLWNTDRVHMLLAIHGLTLNAVEQQFQALQALLGSTGGARLLQAEDACALCVGGQYNTKEHFGYTDGFGNPDYLGICRKTQPGQGKLASDGKTWQPLATGELLLGYADEAGELPVSPVPHLLATNGTFMVYRKIRQRVGAFRKFLNHWASHYGARDDLSREKLAAKFIGRWRDGTPVESSPERMDQSIVQDPNRSTDFLLWRRSRRDKVPSRRPYTPRSSAGCVRVSGPAHSPQAHLPKRLALWSGRASGRYAGRSGWDTLDATDRGILFMALNASLSRQFEFVQQQWISYGNDARIGNEKDLLMSHHEPGERYTIQGDSSASNPPLFCTGLPNFTELRGGGYFFIPSITALEMLGRNLVDPR